MDTNMVIEKNVPVTNKMRVPRRKKRMLKYSWPIKDMVSGDSLFVPMSEFEPAVIDKVNAHKDTLTHTTSNVIKSHKKYYNIKGDFTTRQVVDHQTGVVTGVRIWRIS